MTELELLRHHLEFLAEGAQTKKLKAIAGRLLRSLDQAEAGGKVNA